MKKSWPHPIPILGLFILIIGSFLLWRAANPTPPPFATLPSPNGFDLLTAAAKSLPPSAVASNATTLAALLASHGHSFSLLEQALIHKTEVPITLFDPKRTAGDPLNMKPLSQSLLKKGNLQEQAQDASGAVATYLTTIKLGQSLEHGPLMAFLIGVAIEKKALSELQRLHPTLHPSQQSQLSQDISKLNASRIPWPGVRAREEHFMRTFASNPFILLLARFSHGFKSGLENGEEKHREIQEAFRAFPR